MENKMMKYKNSFFGKFLNKMKLLFFKKPLEKEEILEDNKKEIKEEKKLDNKVEKQKFIELVKKFDGQQIDVNDLTPQEVEQLIKYYDSKNQELDKKIEIQKKTLENLNVKLNRCYEKAIKLKMEV